MSFHRQHHVRLLNGVTNPHQPRQEIRNRPVMECESVSKYYKHNNPYKVV